LELEGREHPRESSSVCAGVKPSEVWRVHARPGALRVVAKWSLSLQPHLTFFPTTICRQNNPGM
jgi:hypothetical protein